jgi:hypothetical protein
MDSTFQMVIKYTETSKAYPNWDFCLENIISHLATLFDTGRELYMKKKSTKYFTPFLSQECFVVSTGFVLFESWGRFNESFVSAEKFLG